MFGTAQYLTRYLRFEFNILLLFSILQTTNLAFAATCNTGLDRGLHIPSTADCRHVISHMPHEFHTVNQTSLSYDHLPYGQVLYPSHPFFPQAQFLHQSCFIKVSYHPNALREIQDLESIEFSLEYPDLVDYLKYYEYPKPTVALHESSVMFIWDAVKTSARHITERCVAFEVTGMDWVWLDLAEDLWLLVEVLASEPQTNWPAEMKKTSPKTMMAVGAASHFQKTLYEV